MEFTDWFCIAGHPVDPDYPGLCCPHCQLRLIRVARHPGTSDAELIADCIAAGSDTKFVLAEPESLLGAWFMSEWTRARGI